MRPRHALLAIVAVGVIPLAGCATADTETSTTPHGPFHATSASVKAAVAKAVNDSDSSPGLDGAPRVHCKTSPASLSLSGRKGINCSITYALKESTGIDNDMELVQPTAGFWKVLFSDRKFQGALVQVKGPTTTVGGKSHVGHLFDLMCDRKANRQIDWDNVDGHGIRTLCVYNARVSDLP